jgi:hypothetical protein
MRKIFYGFMFVFLAVSCVTVTSQQIKTVQQFAGKTGEFASSPSSIMTELAEIRAARGLYYAGSFTDPGLHINELENVIREKSLDDKVPGKVDVLFKVLEKYAAGLEELSSDKPAKTIKVAYSNIGSDLETLVVEYNKADGIIPVPAGIGNMITRSADHATNSFLARKQCRALKGIVNRADTMVSVACGEMAKFLSSDLLETLIQNEETGIAESFRFYFTQRKSTTPESDRDYISLRKRIESVKTLRTSALLTCRHLRIAHKKLAVELNNKPGTKEISDEIIQFFKDVDEMKKLFQKINWK